MVMQGNISSMYFLLKLDWIYQLNKSEQIQINWYTEASSIKTQPKTNIK